LPLTIAAIACASRNTLSVPLNRIVPNADCWSASRPARRSRCRRQAR
jgi:hypothetical protein